MKLNKFAYLYSKPLGNHTFKIMKKIPGNLLKKNLEKSWKNHGILSVRKSGNPAFYFCLFTGGVCLLGEIWLLVVGVCLQGEGGICLSGGRDLPHGDPQVVTCSGVHCSGRYASYWNASLFKDFSCLRKEGDRHRSRISRIAVFLGKFFFQKRHVMKLGVDRIDKKKITAGRARLIRSHSSARFCLELSGNSN